MINEKEIIRLARQCIAMEDDKTRPELLWLREKYDRFCQNHGGLGKAQADRLLYRAMYGCEPENASATLKIRYWRTGQHTPVNREQCLEFGTALELNEEEMRYLLQGYLDRSDRLFEEELPEDPEYTRRRNCIDQQVEEYLLKVHPGIRMQMKISKSSLRSGLRHLYYMDAQQYVDIVKNEDEKGSSKTGHLVSVNYDSELNRNLRLLGEIPRKTMIRHLLILGMPYLNREILDERLKMIGYLPLQEAHTQVGGEYLDWLLIRLLELYEKRCQGKNPETCTAWFQSTCRILDGYFKNTGKENLRFMYFKSLGL
jgi:hypothetical protein